MPSKESEAVKRHWTAVRLASQRPDAEQPNDESWGDLTAEPREVDYVETDAGGLPAVWAVPKRSAEDRVLLCMHGGGFVSGSISSHRKMFGHLAKATGARALIFDYHLAPGHTHPAPDHPRRVTARCSSGSSAGRQAQRPASTAHCPNPDQRGPPRYRSGAPRPMTPPRYTPSSAPWPNTKTRPSPSR
jgi:acetyl esterase/lipase